MSVRTTALAVSLAIALLGSAVIIGQNTDKPDTTLYLYGGFINEYIKPLVKQVELTGHQKTLLTITSYGGIIAEELQLLSAMERNGNIDTYVPSYAYSAGAMAFLYGEERYAPAHASFLFHGTSFGEGMSAPELRRMVISLNEDLEALRLEEGVDYKTIHEAEANIKYWESSISSLDASNAVMLDKFDAIIAESQGKLTREIIKEKLFGNFDRDIYVSGLMLYEMGIVTVLGHPEATDYGDYSTDSLVYYNAE